MNMQSVYTISAGALKGPIGNSSGGCFVRDIPQKTMNRIILIPPSTNARRSVSFFSFFIYSNRSFSWRADYHTTTPLLYLSASFPSLLRVESGVTSLYKYKQEVGYV